MAKQLESIKEIAKREDERRALFLELALYEIHAHEEIEIETDAVVNTVDGGAYIPCQVFVTDKELERYKAKKQERADKKQAEIDEYTAYIRKHGMASRGSND